MAITAIPAIGYGNRYGNFFARCGRHGTPSITPYLYIYCHTCHTWHTCLGGMAGIGEYGGIWHHIGAYRGIYCTLQGRTGGTMGGRHWQIYGNGEIKKGEMRATNELLTMKAIKHVVYEGRLYRSRLDGTMGGVLQYVWMEISSMNL